MTIKDKFNVKENLLLTPYCILNSSAIRSSNSAVMTNAYLKVLTNLCWSKYPEIDFSFSFNFQAIFLCSDEENSLIIKKILL